MRRRASIAFTGCAALLPLAAFGQQPRLPRIGVLVPANPEPFFSVFRQGLSEHGYVEGKNIQFEFRSADGKPEALPGLAQELVRIEVDIIVVWTGIAALAARQASTKIPIVMAAAADPVGMGLVASLAHPGGNITGMSSTGSQLGPKLLEFIRALLSGARRVAVLANALAPFGRTLVREVELGGRALGIAIQPIEVRTVDDYDAAFGAMKKERADAVIVQGSLPRKAAVDMALRQLLPAVSYNALFAKEGGLLSYAPNQSEVFRRSANYIDRILKGARPGDLPVEQPTQFELIINLQTAKAIGITVPRELRVRADQVIE
jgi:putative tryptophan/tyrosine transport system substrate-binding protein